MLSLIIKGFASQRALAIFVRVQHSVINTTQHIVLCGVDNGVLQLSQT